MKWIRDNGNGGADVSSCEMLRPVFDERGQMLRGWNQDGEWHDDPAGPDIRHESIPGQRCLPDDHPDVLAAKARIAANVAPKPDPVIADLQRQINELNTKLGAIIKT